MQFINKQFQVVSLIMFLLFFVLIFTNMAVAAKPVVAVGIVPQQNFVEKIAGDRVDIVTMIPSGYSPGNYAPSPKEMLKFSEADLYFMMGVPAERDNILTKAKDMNPDLKIIRLDKMVAEKFPVREFAPGKRDPHIWLSPLRTSFMLKVIATELARLDPANQALYEENLAGYLKDLQETDQHIKEQLLEHKEKTILVFHPAIGYFTDEYGLNLLTIEEGGKEATPRRMQEVIDQAREKGIKNVFYQQEIDSRKTLAVANELGGKTIQINPLAANYLANLEEMAYLFHKTLLGRND